MNIDPITLVAALFVLFVTAVSGCSTQAQPTPTQAAATVQPAQTQAAQPQAATAASIQPADASQSACVGVKDPQNVSVPSGGNTKTFAAPAQVIDPTHTYCAILTTKQGRIVMQLYPQVAPKNVNSFVFLAQQGYYDNITWHRVIPQFVAQTGDPSGTGAGSPGYNLPLEISPSVKYDRAGVVGVARGPADDSAGSQFFITYAPLPSLDPHSPQLPDSDGYTIMGQVVEGMDVALKITARDPQTNPNYQGDALISIRVVDLGAAK